MSKEVKKDLETKVINEEQYQFESQMFVLHELKDELETAIGNVQTVMSQEAELLDILNKDFESGAMRKHDWNKFKEGMTESKKNYEEQITRMQNKLNHIEALLTAHSKRDGETEQLISGVVEMVVSYVLIAIS